jgi:molybdopterin molybdotransferase
MRGDARYGGMHPLGDVITLDDARARIEAAAAPVAGEERVAVSDAAGRVLAHDVTAPFDVPGFDRAAMDGYAVRVADLEGASPTSPRLLTLAGDARPGALPDVRVEPGTCVAIATGAPIPEGADAVVMVERTGREGNRIALADAPHRGQHISPRGHDIQADRRVLRAGALLTPARVGVLATLGLTSIEVRRRTLVVLMSSGDELLAPGETPAPGRIYDSNSVALEAVCRAHGAATRRLPAVPDTVEGWHAALDAAGDADLVITSGASSAGERDLLPDVVAARGEVIVHGIAVKPGKPTLFGRLGTQLLMGMPGNPTSCLSNAYVLLVPLLRRLAGLPPYRPATREVTLTHVVTSPINRLQFHQVRVEGDRAEPVFKGSGDITSLSEADGYIEVPMGVERVEAGARVVVTLY